MSKHFVAVLLLASAAVSSAQTDSISVVFQLSRALQTGENGVGLNGTMNNWGNVSYSATNGIGFIPLTNTGNNLWEVTVPLAAGVYSYKFITYSIPQPGDTLIAAWITDPGNPKTDGSGYNNSIINVKSPMVYYVSPKSGSTINDPNAAVTAFVSWAGTSDVNASGIGILVDNTPVADAGSYFDKPNRVVNFHPSSPFTFTNHTVTITASNTTGQADTAVSSFKVVNQIIAAPYTFYFDPLSSNFKLVGSLSTVQVKGAFNNYGSDPLSGPDSDGIYSITENLNVGVAYPYQYIINGGQYIDDPDNPLMTPDFETIVVKKVNSYPYFNLTAPRQGQIFATGTSISIRANLMRSDSAIYGIDTSSIAITVDGSPVSNQSIDSIAGGVSIQTASYTVAPGRHVIKFFGRDVKGFPATAYETIGGYNTGFHFVDADSDDNGPGKYTYPSFSPRGSADIKQIDIAANATDDSLLFTVTMAQISDYTRVTFEMVNSLAGSLILDPNKAAVQIPDFTNRGVFFILAAPNSSKLEGTENEVYTSPNIFAAGASAIPVNSDAKTTGVFRFALPLNLLESTMGTFARGWYFTAYSYLGNSSGAWKVTASNGGSAFDEQPNIYDAAFFYNNSIEKRALSNFNFSFNNGGTRYVTFATNLRGMKLIMPSDIAPALAGKPYVNILTNGGNIRWNDTVRVYVAVSDSSVTTGTVSDSTSNYPLTFVGDTAYADVVLKEGLNTIQASVPYDGSKTSYSTRVFFTYFKNHEPNIVISKSINSGTVSIDASGTTNPDGLSQTFKWSQDKSNPQQVSLTSASGSATSFAAPTAKGDYFYTVRCTTSLDSSYARVAVVVDSTVHFPDLTSWHAAWIDSAMIYEIYVKTYSLDGQFSDITSNIKTIKNLGVNTIWLMPIHPTPQLSPSNPGYAIRDYYAVNPSYGTLSDFKMLVDSAHANGIRVMMDYVVNHTHNTNPFMIDAVKYGQYSPFRGFYDWNADGSYKYMFTWTDLPSISYDGPDSARNMNYLINMAKYWVENFKVDGFRCDVAWGINDTRANGPEFWQRWRQALKAIKPDIFLLGELDATQYYSPHNFFDDKFDGGYDYSTINALRNALSNNTLIWQLDSAEAYYTMPAFPSDAVPMKYIENHDEPRFISQYSLQQTKLAATIEFALPGVPLIYSGQEVGEQTQRGIVDWTDPNGLLPFYQNLTKLRHSFESLQTGKYFNVSTSSPDTVFAFARVSDTLSALVAANFTGNGGNFTLSADTTQFKMKDGVIYYFNDVVNGAAYPVTKSSLSHLTVNLGPYQASVMILADTDFVTAVKELHTGTPIQYSLDQNYPNPFNPTTTIRFSIAGHSITHVSLEVYNVLGQKVKTLVDDFRPQGFYTINWDSRNSSGNLVASGVYFYVLRTNNFVQSKKMLLLK